jgi:hypothetical protein
MTKADMLTELSRVLREVLALQNAGAAHPKLARAQGFVDGYMRALLESGAATQRELLTLVAEERRRTNGPATAEATFEAIVDAVA